MRTATLGSFLNLRRGVLIEAVVADSDSGPTQPTYYRFTAMGLSPEAGCPLGSSIPEGGIDGDLITKKLGADRSDYDRCGLENR